MSIEEIKIYMKEKKLANKEQRTKKFSEIAKRSFGSVDEDTLQYRKQCHKAGFDVVFRSGLTREDVLDFFKKRGLL